VNVRPPLVALAAFALGIVAAPWLTGNAPPLAAALALLPCLGAVLLFRSRPLPLALALCAAFFAFGLWRAQTATRRAPGDVSYSIGGPSLWVRGVVASDLEARANGKHAFRLDVSAVNDYVRPRLATGGLQVTLRPDLVDDENTLAPGAEVWLRGQIEAPPPATNPNGFDYAAYLARRGVYATLAPRRAADVRSTGRVIGSPALRLAAGLRHVIQQQTHAHLSPADAGLLDGLLLGIRAALPGDLNDAFSRTGTVHVLSTSGLHLVVLAGSLAALFRLLPIAPRTANVASILLVWLYALAAGFGPAVARSVLTLTILLLAPLLKRQTDPLGSLIAAGFVILVASPLALYDAGTQLSFATVATILAWLPAAERLLFPWEPGMDRAAQILRFAGVLFVVGIVAQAGSWPLTAYHFNLFSVVALVANPPLVLLTEGLLLGGLGAVLLGFLPAIVTAPLWGTVSLGLALLRLLALGFAALPFAAVSVASPPVGFILVYYALLWGIAPRVNRIVLRRTLFAPGPPHGGGFGPAGGGGGLPLAPGPA